VAWLTLHHRLAPLILAALRQSHTFTVGAPPPGPREAIALKWLSTRQTFVPKLPGHLLQCARIKRNDGQDGAGLQQMLQDLSLLPLLYRTKVSVELTVGAEGEAHLRQIRDALARFQVVHLTLRFGPDRERESAFLPITQTVKHLSLIGLNVPLDQPALVFPSGLSIVSLNLVNCVIAFGALAGMDGFKRIKSIQCYARPRMPSDGWPAPARP
jgi:hypothetical protein